MVCDGEMRVGNGPFLIPLSPVSLSIPHRFLSHIHSFSPFIYLACDSTSWQVVERGKRTVSPQWHVDKMLVGERAKKPLTSSCCSLQPTASWWGNGMKRRIDEMRQWKRAPVPSPLPLFLPCRSNWQGKRTRKSESIPFAHSLSYVWDSG